MLTVYDSEHSEHEERWTTLGIAATGRMLVVCHTYHEDSDDVIRGRLFSSRKATKQEATQYAE